MSDGREGEGEGVAAQRRGEERRTVERLCLTNECGREWKSRCRSPGAVARAGACFWRGPFVLLQLKKRRSVNSIGSQSQTVCV